jgi:hypothetical protein
VCSGRVHRVQSPQVSDQLEGPTFSITHGGFLAPAGGIVSFVDSSDDDGNGAALVAVVPWLSGLPAPADGRVSWAVCTRDHAASTSVTNPGTRKRTLNVFKSDTIRLAMTFSKSFPKHSKTEGFRKRVARLMRFRDEDHFGSPLRAESECKTSVEERRTSLGGPQTSISRVDTLIIDT